MDKKEIDMKDLLETAKSFYVGKPQEELNKIQKELMHLYDYSQQKWWLPFRLQVRFCEPFRIGTDLAYLSEVVDRELESFNKNKLSSKLIKTELEKRCPNNKIDVTNRLLIKTQILNKYSSKKSAAFLLKIIKEEYFIQRRRWWLGIIIGWILGLITALAVTWVKFILDSSNKISVDMPR